MHFMCPRGLFQNPCTDRPCAWRLLFSCHIHYIKHLQLTDEWFYSSSPLSQYPNSIPVAPMWLEKSSSQRLPAVEHGCVLASRRHINLPRPNSFYLFSILTLMIYTKMSSQTPYVSKMRMAQGDESLAPSPLQLYTPQTDG
jgi:hypothetical protein